MPIDPLDSTHIIKNFPDAALLDIARNDSAQYDYRLFAVELLHTRKSEKLKHPDIQHLVQDLEIELEGIVFDHPAPGPGPMKAGVTLKTLYGTPEQQFTGFDFEVSDLAAYTLKSWIGRSIAPQTLETNTGSEHIGEGVVVDIPPTEPTPIPTEPTEEEPDAA